MGIKKIRKLNLQNGDIIFMPNVKPKIADDICESWSKKFPNIEFIVMIGTPEQVAGIKVVHLPGDKK